MKEMFARVVETFGSVDVPVNNAGVQKPAPSHEIDVADSDAVVGVNLRGAFLCAREIIRHVLRAVSVA